MSHPPAGSLLARIQGWYYLATGIWPLVAGHSFQIVTGFKADFWLAQTVGLLLAISGAVLVLAARAHRLTPEIMLLAAGEALVLAAVDVWCVFEPRTTPLYWGDALVELILLAAWVRVWRQRRARAAG